MADISFPIPAQTEKHVPMGFPERLDLLHGMAGKHETHCASTNICVTQTDRKPNACSICLAHTLTEPDQPAVHLSFLKPKTWVHFIPSDT